MKEDKPKRTYRRKKAVDVEEEVPKKKRSYTKKTKDTSAGSTEKKPRKKRITKAEKERLAKEVLLLKEAEDKAKKEAEEKTRLRREKQARKQREAEEQRQLIKLAEERKKKEIEDLKRKEEKEKKEELLKQQEKQRIENERKKVKQQLEADRIAEAKRKAALRIEKQRKQQEEEAQKRKEKAECVEKIQAEKEKKEREEAQKQIKNVNVRSPNIQSIKYDTEIIVSSSVNDSAVLQAEYISPQINKSDTQMHSCVTGDVVLHGIIFMYSNCYKDSFDLQIVCEKTEYEKVDTVTHIGIDGKGRIVPMNGGTLKIVTAKPVYCPNNCGNWVLNGETLMQRTSDMDVAESYHLYAFNNKIKSVFIDMMVAGTGTLTFDFVLEMKKGYAIVFEHYFSDLTTLGAKQAIVNLKYSEK